MSTLNYEDAASFLNSHLASKEIQSMKAHVKQICVKANAKDSEASNTLLADFTELYESGVFAYLGEGDRAAVNLSAMVVDPFTDDASFNPELFGKLMYSALRLLDNLKVDTAKPMLNINGLAETLMMMGFSYDSKQGRHVASSLMRFVRDEIFHAALRLTYERGTCSQFNADKYLSSGYGKSLPSDFKDDIRQYGLRFPKLLTIDNDPFASICLFSGVTPGVMPPPAWVYHWSMYNTDNHLVLVRSTNNVQQRFANRNGELPLHCKTALDLNVEDYTLMLQKIKRFIDGNVSRIDSTVKVNLETKRQSTLTREATKFTVVPEYEKPPRLDAVHRFFDLFVAAST